MSKTHQLPVLDGVYTFKTSEQTPISRQLSLAVQGPAPAGTLTVLGRVPGSSVFEPIPEAVFNLAELYSVQFIGAVAEYEVTLEGVTGVTSISLSDTNS